MRSDREYRDDYVPVDPYEVAYKKMTEEQRLNSAGTGIRERAELLYENTLYAYDVLRRRKMSRKDMAEELQFLSADSGHGYGVCDFAGAMLTAMYRGPGWKSWALFTHDTKVHATVEEMRWFCAFSRAYNARMDAVLGPWRHSNSAWMMGIRRRADGSHDYFHKRQSGRFGQYYSPTLNEAILFACGAV